LPTVKRPDRLVVAAFWVYVLVIIFGIFLKATAPEDLIENYLTYKLYYTERERLMLHMNPLGFLKTVDFSQGFNYGWFWELILNIIVFIPFGILLPNLFRGRAVVLKTFLASLFFSALVEISQYLTIIGAWDTLDVIANSLGGLLGGIIYAIFARLIRLPKILYKILTVIFLCVSSTLLTYLTVNAAIHLDVYVYILSGKVPEV